jgi:hypothetical protein
MIYKRPESIEISSQTYADRYGSEQQAKQHFFNIGAGAWSHPCWTNVALPAQTEAFAKIQAPFIAHDLVNDSTLPIAPPTASIVRMSWNIFRKQPCWRS